MWYKTCAEKIVGVIKKIPSNLYAFYSCILKLSIKVWGQRQIDGQMAKHGTLFLSFSIILLGVKLTEKDLSIGIISTPPDSLSTVFRAYISIVIIILVLIFMWIWQKYKLGRLVKKQSKYLMMLIVFLLLSLAFWLLPPIPASSYGILGKIALGISAIFMLAVFWKWFSVKLTEIIEGQFQYIYWVIFWVVYIIGFLKGLSNIPKTEIIWPFFIGYAWFIIIGIILLKTAWQTGKR
jgi:membrane-associated HD superfamily phosphohydrolase